MGSTKIAWIAAAVAGWLVVVGLLIANLVVETRLDRDIVDVRDTAAAESNSGDVAGAVAQLSSDLNDVKERLRTAPWPTPTPLCQTPPCTPPALQTAP